MADIEKGSWFCTKCVGTVSGEVHAGCNYGAAWLDNAEYLKGEIQSLTAERDDWEAHTEHFNQLYKKEQNTHVDTKAERDELADKLHVSEEVVTGLRRVIQVIADKLGVGDEPRCKWITSEIDSLQAEVTVLREAISSALAISDLWIPGVVDTEHEDEARALHTMRTMFLKALASKKD